MVDVYLGHGLLRLLPRVLKKSRGNAKSQSEAAIYTVLLSLVYGAR
jgi:hypothetical protein